MDKTFINKLEEELSKHKPWTYEGSIWANESQYVNWLRSQFRSMWTDYPVRNTYLSDREIQFDVKDSEGNQVYYKTGKRAGQPKTQAGYICELTGNVIKKSKPKGQRFAHFNVDHIDPSGSCTTVEEALIYFLRLLTSPDNMQLIDTRYHKIITHYDSYKDKYGFTCFNDASAHKQMKVIAKNSKSEIQWLKGKGITPETNSDKRQTQIYNYLKEHIEDLEFTLDYK